MSPTAMPETTFSVKYEGPALREGRMPVRDLAPALLSLGELFTEASLTLYPTYEPVGLDIEATAAGSFNVELVLQTADDVWEQISGLSEAGAVTSLILLKDLVVGGSVDSSLFGLIKWLRGRPATEEPSPEPGRVRITVDDRTSVDVPTEVATLHRNVRVRKKAREVVQPLHRRGVDSVEFRTDADVSLSINDDELPAFEPIDPDADQLTEQEFDQVLEIITPQFKENNMWRFSDGERQFHAPILDAEFLERVDAGEPFRKGDRLRARVQLIQFDEGGKLRTERRVVEVFEHRQAGQQLALGEGGEEDGEPPPELPPGKAAA